MEKKYFIIVDIRVKFYSQNTYLLPPKPKSSFRHLKQGVQGFHRKHALVSADKAANDAVAVKYIWSHLDNNSLCIDYHVEGCRVSAVLFGSMLPGLGLGH